MFTFNREFSCGARIPVAAIFVLGALALHCAGNTRGADLPRSESPRGSYAFVNGLNMYYETCGSGRPLVLLHGGGSTAQTSFGALIPALAKHHRVIAPEQQGHGHTADIDRPFSLEQMANDTAMLLRKLRIEQADLIGFSTGGTLAIKLAIEHPTLVRRIVVASAFVKRDAMPPQFWEGMKHASADAMPSILRNAYLAASPEPNLERLVDKTKTMLLAFEDVSDEQLRAIRAPTLVMMGDSDVVRTDHALEMFRKIPRAQLAVFPGAPHGAYIGAAEYANSATRQPEWAAGMIEEFLHAP